MADGFLVDRSKLMTGTPEAEPPPAAEGVTWDDDVQAEPAPAGVTWDEPAPEGVTWDEEPVVDPVQVKRQQENAQLKTMFDTTFLTGNADRQADVLSLARETGLPAEAIDADYDGFLRTYESNKRDVDAWRRENPRLAQMLLSRPDLVEVTKQDTWLSRFGAKLGENLGIFLEQHAAGYDSEKLQTAVEHQKELYANIDAPKTTLARKGDGTTPSSPALAVEEYQRGALGTERSRIGFQIALRMAQGEDTFDLDARELALEQQSLPIARDLSGVDQFISEVASNASSSYEGVKAFGVEGGAAAALTYGATRSGKAAMTVGKFVGTAGQFRTSFELETGSALLEYRKLKTDDGKPLSSTTVVGAATLYGVLSATVESVSFADQLKNVGPLAEALKAGRKGFMQRLLKDRSLMALAKHVGESFLRSAKDEGGEEFAQSILEDVVGYGAKSVEAGGFQKADPIGAIKEAIEAARLGAQSGVVMGGAMGGGTVAVQVAATPKIVGMLGEQSAAERGAAVVEAIVEGKESPTARAAPKEVADLIEKTTQDTGEAVTSLYVDPSEFTKLYQSPREAKQASFDLMGEKGPERLAEALATGQHLEVPLEEYNQKWLNTDAAASLAKHTTTRPGRRTAATLKEGEKEIEATADEIAKQAEAAKEEESALDQRLSRMEKQLVDTGRMKPQDASRSMAVWRAALTTLSQRFGKDAEALFDKMEARVVKGEDGVAPDQDPKAAAADLMARAEAEFLFGDLEADTSEPGANDGVDDSQRALDFEQEMPEGPSAESVSAAREEVGRMLDTAKQAQATAFIDYATGKTTERPAISADLEKRLARHGVVDPKGFTFGEDGRSLERPLAGKKRKGVEPAEFRRRRLETIAGRIGKWEDASYRELYEQPGKAEQPSVPEASLLLAERLLGVEEGQGLPKEERARDLYIDPVSGLLNRKAWNALPRTAGKMVAVITTPDVKAVNDDPSGGHDTANAMLRTMGRIIGAHDERAARGGTSFILEVKDAKEFKALVEQVKAALPDPEFVVAGGIGSTVDNAFEASDKGVDRKRARGDYAKRGGTKVDLSKLAEMEAKFSKEPLQVDVPSELVERVGGMSDESFFKETYLDEKMPGVLSYAGWQNTPRKQHVVSIDLKGLKAINKTLGDDIGDKMLALFAATARDNGGSDFDFAHLSGDEYAAQHDDREALEGFLADLRTTLQNVGVPATYRGEEVELHADFRHGIGEGSYGAADRALNVDKRREATKANDVRGTRGSSRGEPGAAEEGSQGPRDRVPGESHLQGRRDHLRRGTPPQAFPGRRGARRGEVDRLNQRAFHGSPHDFDAFSMQHIGTGEGAQVYGHGLYFAQNKATGEFYRQQLAGVFPTIDKKKKEDLTLPEAGAMQALLHARANLGRGVLPFEQALPAAIEKMEKDLEGRRSAYRGDPQSAMFKRTGEAIASMEAQLTVLKSLTPERLSEAGGQLFEVDVPENNELVDWDAKLADQPEEVLAKLDIVVPGLVRVIELTRAMDEIAERPSAEFTAELKSKHDDLRAERKPLLEKLKAPNGEQVTPEYHTGRVLYRQLAEGLGSEEAASAALLKAGIPGLRYLDQGSRGAGEGTHNFVVWDDSRVKVNGKFYQDTETPRGYLNIIRSQLKTVYEIGLNKNSDLSTFLHESGHAFLDLYEQLSATPDAPGQVRADFDEMMRWSGYGSREQMMSMRAERVALAGQIAAEQRKPTETEAARLKELAEPDETFARGFEAYLFEGKAPSAALERVFKAFASWLKRIYKSIAGLNVELSPEIRGVFDRMLATDDEIARYKDRMGLGFELFKSPDEAGMTPQEWQAYLEDQERATSSTERRATLRAMKDRLREQEKWWKDEMEAQRELARAKYDQLPARRAKDVLDGKGWGIEGETPVPVVLSRAVVEEAIGKEAAKKFRLRKDGVHPDEVADLMGYPTGLAMLEAIRDLPERDAWVEGEAHAAMLDEHGGVFQEKEKLRDEVAKGLHGDHTAAWLVRELDALRKQAGQGPSPAAAIKRAADKMVERRAVRKLDVGGTLRAERSAADKALRAAAKGDYAQAAVFKQQQLLNLHLHRALSEARDERDGFEDLAKRLSKDAARATLGKAGPVYRDGVDAILEKLGLHEAREREETPSVQDIVGALEADGATVLFDSGLLAQVLSGGKQWKDLTVAEMREVVGALKNIEGAGRNKATVLIDGQRVDKEETIAALVAEAQENLKSRGPVPSSPSAMSGLEKAGGWFNAFTGSVLKPEVLVDWLGEKWFRAITKPLQDAKAREVDILQKVIKPIVEVFDAMPKEVRAKLMEKVDGKALLPNHKIDSNIQDLAPPSRRFELLMMALHSGNPENRSRLLEGRNINEVELRAALDLLSKEEVQWINAVHQAFESLWPAMADLEERDSGLRPRKVKHDQFAVKNGVISGYAPAIYDSRVEPAGERQVSNAIAGFLDSSFTRPTTPHGHLKSRVQGFVGVLSLEPSVISRHLAQAAHDIAFREAVKSVGGLIMSPDIQAVLKDRLGEGRSKQLVQWVKDVGQMRGIEGMQHAKWALHWMRKVKSNAVIAALGFSIPNMIEDLSNLPAAVARTDLKTANLAAAVGELLAHPGQTTDFAESKSGELRARRDQLQRELTKRIDQLVKSGPFAKGPLAWVRDHAFVFMEFSDKYTSTPVWLGLYRQGLADGLSDADAVTFADRNLRKVFPTHSAVDLAPVLRDKTVIGTMLTMYGFLSTGLSGIADITHRLGRVEGAWSKAKVAGQLMAYITCITVLGELLKRRGPEKDEEWWQWYLRKMALGSIATLPFGGDLSNYVDSKVKGTRPNPKNTSFLSPVVALLEALSRLNSERTEDRKNIEVIVAALGTLLGVPVAQPKRTGGYIWDISEGKVKPDGPLDVAGGLVYGTPKN